jgi:hypothetical protein
MQNLQMPTVLREGPDRFFYSNDRSEPLHIHVERDGRVAKYWLEPVELQKSGGHRESELRRIEKIIKLRLEFLTGKWHGFFNN